MVIDSDKMLNVKRIGCPCKALISLSTVSTWIRDSQWLFCKMSIQSIHLQMGEQASIGVGHTRSMTNKRVLVNNVGNHQGGYLRCNQITSKQVLSIENMP